MDETTKKRLIISVIVVVVIIIILFLLAILIGGVSRLDWFSSQSFTSGYSGSFLDASQVDKDALIVFFNENRELLKQTQGSERMDVGRVVSVYHKFVQNCNQSRCPKSVYNSAKEMLDFIHYEPDFSNLNSNGWRHVRLGLNQMDDLLKNIFESVLLISDTVAGNKDSYLSGLSEAYSSNTFKKGDFDMETAMACKFKGAQAEQVANDFKEQRLLSNLKDDDTYLNSINIYGGKSAYEYQVLEGKVLPYNGNPFEYSRNHSEQITDFDLIDSDRADVDMNHHQGDGSGKIRAYPTISNYSGRHARYPNDRSSCNKKKCESGCTGC